MSCMLLSATFTRRLAHTLADVLTAASEQQVCTVDSIAAKSSGIQHSFSRYYSATRRRYNAIGIAEDLYRLNMCAYNSRYPSTGDPDMFPLPDFPQEYSIRQAPDFDRPLTPRPWHYQLCKMLDCWLYQTDEDATRADLLRVAVADFRAALADAIVTHTAAYERCEWGK